MKIIHFISFSAILLLLSFGSCAQQVKYPEIRSSLLEMKKIDQDLRLGKRTDLDISKMDIQHTKELENIIDNIGWPTPELVGDDGSSAAWLLAQHADLNPEFQKYVLSLLEPLAKEKRIKQTHFVYLYDRTNVPQRFGTQGRCVNGVWGPDEIEDPSKVDELRKEYGMTTLEQYTTEISEYCSKP